MLRNLENQVIFVRYVPARTIRCMRLDAPIVVEKKVIHDGQEIVVPTLIGERRYARLFGAIWIYCRCGGVPRLDVLADRALWQLDHPALTPPIRIFMMRHGGGGGWSGRSRPG